MNNKLQEKRKLLFKQFKNANQRLISVLEKEKDEFIRDSAIQRFEFTFELAWKVLKTLLEEKGILVYSPRDAIKNAFQVGLIEEAPEWLDMIDARNLTSHVYEENQAEEVYDQLKNYLIYLNKLALQLQDI